MSYLFSGLHAGDHCIGIIADPARLDIVTTDLGHDRLRNRTITLLVSAVLIGGCIVGPITSLLGNRGASRGAAG
ncbi:hypothetical protein MKK58_00350 [Methylobacterium sp. J-078]|uniref:hypothetical protein n=1 Tax=Methylobacterium sp. J-078 TaxID=2836657 RepID=UPI001FB9E9D8|nr:hypothetical protein [Methylobacterium sp. J-078]MCJ2043010.1 hypothetical protein [Methylobacterium sp. J-078]